MDGPSMDSFPTSMSTDNGANAAAVLQQQHQQQQSLPRTRDYLGLVPASDAKTHEHSDSRFYYSILPNLPQMSASVNGKSVPIQKASAKRKAEQLAQDSGGDDDDDDADFAPYEGWNGGKVSLETPKSKQGSQLSFLDLPTVTAIKNTFAELADLAHDKDAKIEVLNRRTFYTIKLQKANKQLSVFDLNTKLSALPLCISGIEFKVQNNGGGGQLSVDFAKKDRFSALTQLEGSAKRERGGPLFGTEKLPYTNGSKRAKLTKAGGYAVSAATDYGVAKHEESTDLLSRVRRMAGHADFYAVIFDHTLDDKKEETQFTLFDLTLLRRIVEYGITVCGAQTPSDLKWCHTTTWPDKEDRVKCYHIITFEGFVRLNFDQLRGFHDLFPHHVIDVGLHIGKAEVNVYCSPYLQPIMKPWASTLFYRPAV